MPVSINEFLVRTEQSLNNSLADADIMNAVSAYGYDQSKLDAILALCQGTKQLNEAQDAELGDQYLASKDYLSKRELFDQNYSAHIKLARIAFRGNPQAKQSLLLGGTRKKAYKDWLIQRETFYHNLDSKQNFKDTVAAFIPAAQITTGISDLNAIKSQYETYGNERNEAQRATESRDVSLDQLKRQISDFYTVAKIALANNPQKLEKLGYTR